MQKNLFFVGYKLFFGLLGTIAIFTEIIVGLGRGVLIPANFFSFFTIEANIFAAIIFLIGGFALLRGKTYKYGALLRGAATLYMITTGIIFGVLLSGYDPTLLTFVPWDNIVLHYIIPVAVFADWLIDPPKIRLSFKKVLVWLIFPFTYLAYTLIRGAITGRYPYPFLDPANQHGYAGIAVTTVGITVTVLVITWMLTLVTRLRHSRKS
jgi:hypothetical protein